MKKYLLFIGGLLILSFGIALFIQSNTGSDPFTTFNIGMSRNLGLLFSIVQVSANGIILLIIWMMEKKYIKLGTLLAMLIVGPLIEVNVYLLDYVFNFFSLQFNPYLLLIIGCLLVCMGAGIYIATNFGAGPYDIIPLLAEEKFGYSFKVTRILSDVLCVILGGILGATIGIGTVLAAFCLGPGIEYFRRLTQHYILQER